MSKRIAGSQMTQDNWDKEDEQEEAGVFKLASDDVMKERKVIKPRRKLGEGTGGDSGSSGAFKGFGGFGATKSAAGGPGLFSFGTGPSKPLSGLSNGAETKPSTDFKLTSFQTQTNSSAGKKDEKDNESEKPKTATNGVGKTDGATRSKYLHQLKCLNEGVTKWIKQHVDKNPYCILTPIFKDYEKHLAEIEKQNPENEQPIESKETVKKEEEKKEESKPTSTTSETKATTLSSAFTFGSSTANKTSSSTSTTTTTSSTGTSLFSFGAAKTSSSSTTGTSVFGGAAASSGATGFSFGTGSTGMKPFSFATGGATGAASSSSADNASQETAGEDEEYVPPKAEVSEIKEDDSLYSKRCKMYYNKDGTWIEKGVGNLHLKPCSGKTQLLIRADTNLGNILLNIMLNSQMPFARQGKNNVTFMCVPNPALDPKDTGDPKPSSILLRVKTGDDADELLKNINKHKGE